MTDSTIVRAAERILDTPIPHDVANCQDFIRACRSVIDELVTVIELNDIEAESPKKPRGSRGPYLSAEKLLTTERTFLANDGDMWRTMMDLGLSDERSVRYRLDQLEARRASGEIPRGDQEECT